MRKLRHTVYDWYEDCADKIDWLTPQNAQESQQPQLGLPLKDQLGLFPEEDTEEILPRPEQPPSGFGRL